MADVKKVRVSYIVEMEHEEFQLLFRAIGQTCGAKVRVKHTEMEALRELNVKLAKIRAATIRQMFGCAEADEERANALLESQLPAETPE